MLARLALLLTLGLTVPPALGAQVLDERTVTSPDGRMVFRLFVAPQEPGGLSRLAYAVLVQGEPVIETSYLGFDIQFQEPLLGENLGLVASHAQGLVSTHTAATPAYHSLIAEFLQNGSIGRRVHIEVRAFNDGVAFRYVLPRQTPLEELLIADEVTEFSFRRPVDTPARAALPLIVPLASGFAAIAEARRGVYPAASLIHLNPATLLTRLAHSAAKPEIAYEGRTPFTSPWRVIVFGQDRARLLQSAIFSSLNSE